MPQNSPESNAPLGAEFQRLSSHTSVPRITDSPPPKCDSIPLIGAVRVYPSTMTALEAAPNPLSAFFLRKCLKEDAWAGLDL